MIISSNPRRSLRFVTTATLALVGLVYVHAQAPMAPPAPPSAEVTIVLPQPTDMNLRAYVELTRNDIQMQKSLIISQNITFTESEAADFWPLQREYERALLKVLDQRVALIKEYMGKTETITNDDAAAIAAKFFAFEHERVKLKETWFPKFAQVVTAKKAVRFFQIENQLNAAIDLRLAAALPILR